MISGLKNIRAALMVGTSSVSLAAARKFWPAKRRASIYAGIDPSSSVIANV